jgi:D-galactarolactone cycloisomerase
MTSCLSGIDVACLDAIGEILGLPVVKLLGGPARDRLPIYASGGYFTKTPEKDFPGNSNDCASKEFSARRSRSALVRSLTASASRSPARCSAMICIIVDANGNYTVP